MQLTRAKEDKIEGFKHQQNDDKGSLRLYFGSIMALVVVAKAV